MDYIDTYQSPLGPITLASNGIQLTGLWFQGQFHYASTLDPNHKNEILPIFQITKLWLDLYFSGKIPDFTPSLAPTGTTFRQEIWKILLTIPYGQTITYSEIASIYAKQQGKIRMSAQAVGNAVGHNPISLIIPCHRVIGSNGALTGYAGGLDRKSFLLTLEQMHFAE